MNRIYAIRDDDRTLVKIGLSKNPVDRCRNLQALGIQLGQAMNLVLIGSQPISPDWLELQIHRALADARTVGEWFKADDANVVEFIREVIILNAAHRHTMKPGTWLYRRGWLPEAWKPTGGLSTQEIVWRQKLRDIKARQEAALREREMELGLGV